MTPDHLTQYATHLSASSASGGDCAAFYVASARVAFEAAKAQLASRNPSRCLDRMEQHMTGTDIEGVSPEALRVAARAEWDVRFSRTCLCSPIDGVRFEADGMRCGACDRPIIVTKGGG